MQSVFEDSQITLSAGATYNPLHGLFHMRHPEYAKLDSSASCTTKEDRIFLGRIKSYGRWQTTTSHRGWTLQETILSPAVLHFHPEQLIWECRSELAFEDGRCFGVEPLLKTLVRDPDTPFWDPGLLGMDYEDLLRDGYEKWYFLIEQYSGRRLTFGSDKLPAVAGLASSFSSRIQGRYLAGLWEADLLRGLLWSVMTRWAAVFESSELSYSPSWTWAHMDCMVSWESWHHTPDWDRSSRGWNWNMEIIQSEVRHGSGGATGHILGGKIEATGSMRQVTYSWSENKIGGFEDVQNLRCKIDCEAVAFVIKYCWCLLVGTCNRRAPGEPSTSYFLLLVKTNSTDAEYRRIGIAWVECSHSTSLYPVEDPVMEEWYASSSRTRFTLV